ncbi:hypothetical protein MNBD_BACTEROID03-1892 [hydrothermal vent metagenome]|uniref:Lipoprotein n=1 Tax=hydrothermal vent metagenome TaxID=652676 RepID=A0A3B0U466_9ZZZZ
MNKSICNSVLFYMILFFAASCGKGEDGGKGTVVTSFFENKSENNIKLLFFVSDVKKELNCPKRRNSVVVCLGFASSRHFKWVSGSATV